ncbi:hypothetical protein Tco_1122379 [Tanacetum coccineum]|uniref:Uncharacterized protein n=1 Tax=Tanacetum coccineum TaxID=301880 RepID=A0ABQ5J0E6_9ASTR
MRFSHASGHVLVQATVWGVWTDWYPSKVMAAPVIPISPDSFEESVGGAVFVTSPIGVLDLVDYSSSDSDPSKDSLPPAPELSLVLPFLCSDNSEADTESEPAKQRPRGMSLLSFMMLWFRGGGTGSHLGYPHHQDHHLMTHLHDHLSFPLLLLLPQLGFVDGQRFLSHLRRLFLSVDLTVPILKGSVRGCDASDPLLLPVPSYLIFHRFDSSLTYANLLPLERDAVAVLALVIGSSSPKDGICMGVEVATSDIREDKEELKSEASMGGMMEITVDPLVTGGISESTGGDVLDLEGTLYDIAYYMSEVPLDRIIEFETAHKQLEAGQLMMGTVGGWSVVWLRRESLFLTDWIKRLGWIKYKVQDLLCIERDQVIVPLYHHDLSQEEFCQIRRDRDDAQRRLCILELFVERRLGFRP